MKPIILGGLISNALFASTFTLYRWLAGGYSDGWLDWIVLVVASFGVFIFYRPPHIGAFIVSATYNALSNLYLAILIVYAVFGLAV